MQLRASVVTAAVAAALLLGSATASAAQATSQLPAQAVPQIPKQADAVGTGGAVASDDVEATSAGLEVLRDGGNAVDAAVAVAATLGVTDPFVAGIGGGGFLVYYDARTHRVSTIDGRETAPQLTTQDLFIDPATGKPLAFPAAVTSGLSVGRAGHAGDLAEGAAASGAPRASPQALRPAERVAGRASRWTRRSVSRSARTRPRSRSSPRPASCTCPAGAARGRVDVPQPATWRDLRGDRRAGAPARSTAARSAATSSTPSQHLPLAAGRDAARPRPGLMRIGDLRDLRRARAGPDPRELPRLRRLRHGALRPAAGSPSGRRSTS